ncbi:MAG: ABC transporter ATP-binding protein [Bacteroidales bacterium]|jgi:putative ABC transport system ATP-binding protein|nr:ABC transporter ATP-binding protein [Bacteroidales bacterium]
MKTLIKVENLIKKYRTEEIETTALNKVNFEVQEGEFVAIMGPSGCGKTTFLNVIGLLDNMDGGEYNINGSNTSGLNKKQRNELRTKTIGFVFQNFNLIDDLTLFENVELPLVYAKVPSKERKERVNKILERMGILHRAKHFPQQLSGGQQQRVAVARALITNPKLILADEPTGNLDSKSGNEVMNLLIDLNEQGTTIIMVTHSNHDASFANRVVNLLDGQVVNEKINRPKYEFA